MEAGTNEGKGEWKNGGLEDWKIGVKVRIGIATCDL
jgi:hypothetical protein